MHRQSNYFFHAHHRDGLVGKDEFKDMCGTREVQAWLKILGLDNYDTSVLFHLLDSNDDGVMTYDEFIQGLMRVRGMSRAIDIAAMQQDTELILQKLENLGEIIE